MPLKAPALSRNKRAKKLADATASPSTPFSPSSSSSSPSPTPGEQTFDSFERYSSTTASPSNFSPVSFMTDSNRSAPTPTPPPPPQGHVEERSSDATPPPLVSYCDASLLLGDGVEETNTFAATPAARVKSGVSFPSSLFSFSSSSTLTAGDTAKTGVAASPSAGALPSSPQHNESASELLPPSPSTSQPASQEISDATALLSRFDSTGTMDLSQIPLLGTPPSSSTTQELAEAKGPDIAHEGNQATRTSGRHKKKTGPKKTARKATSQPARRKKEKVKKPSLQQQQQQGQQEQQQLIADLGTASNETPQAACVPASLLKPTQILSSSLPQPSVTAGLTDAHDCPTLSQLAADLLYRNESDTEKLLAKKPQTNTAQLTWIPRPLPSPTTNKAQQKGAGSAATDGATTPLSNESATAFPANSEKVCDTELGINEALATPLITTPADVNAAPAKRKAPTPPNAKGSAKKKRTLEEPAETTPGSLAKQSEVRTEDEKTQLPDKTGHVLQAQLQNVAGADAPPSQASEIHLPARKRKRQPRFAMNGTTAFTAPATAPPPPSLGDFNMENWSTSNQFRTQTTGGGVSRLSQLSYLIADDFLKGEELPAMRFNKQKRSLTTAGEDVTDAAAVARGRVEEGPLTVQHGSQGASLSGTDEAQSTLGTILLGPDSMLDSNNGDELLISSFPSLCNSVSPTGDLQDLPVSSAPAATQTVKKEKKKKQSPPPEKDNDNFQAGSLMSGPASEEAPRSVGWWSATRDAAGATRPPSSRCCLWVELTEGFQDTHSGALRQLLVYWGGIHQKKVARAGRSRNHRRKSEATPNNDLQASATVSCDLQKGWSASSSSDALGRQQNTTSTLPNTPQTFTRDFTSSLGFDGVVVLLCSPSISLTETLQWWTQRAHVAHGYMPPLLAVSMSAEPSTRTNLSFAKPEGSQGTPADALLKQAFLRAACELQMDPHRSLAVSCSEGGRAAFAQALPRSQVFTSLLACAGVLANILNFPSPKQVCAAAAAGAAADGQKIEDIDVGSLAAVMATTTHFDSTTKKAASAQGSASDSSSMKRHPAPTLQDRCFEKLCEWNGLAARLRDRPRRPQLLLQRTCVGVVGDLESQTTGQLFKNNESANKSSPSNAPSAHRAEALSVLWLSYGLVRPAVRNEETFADTARRDARLLASHVPSVTLLPTHMSALSLFAAALFTRGNYATAVNVIDAHARDGARRLTDYVSGYGCWAAGPLCYTVTATVRRYLHVRLSVNVAPLLALVSTADSYKHWLREQDAKSRLRRRKTTEPDGKDANPNYSVQAEANAAQAQAGAVAHDYSETVVPSSAQAVVHLARTRWRIVVGSLSCTCKPRVYEQVAHTADGTKVCRHLAELFYYFVTQQFCVVPGAQPDASWQISSILRDPERRFEEAAPLDHVHESSPESSVEKSCGTKEKAERGNHDATQRFKPSTSPHHNKDRTSTKPDSSDTLYSRTESESDDDDDSRLLNNIPLSLLYSRFASTLASHEGEQSTHVAVTDSRNGFLTEVAEMKTEEASGVPTNLSVQPTRELDGEETAGNGSSSPQTSPTGSHGDVSPTTTTSPAQPAPPAEPQSADRFHTEALQYALRYVLQRREAVELPNVTNVNDQTTKTVPSPATACESARAASSAQPNKGHTEVPLLPQRSEEEEVRALQLVEQLLRNALR